MRYRWTIWLLLCTLIIGCGASTPASTATPANVTAVPTDVLGKEVGPQVPSGAPTTSPPMPTTAGPSLGSDAPPTEVAPPGEVVGPGATPAEVGPPGEGGPPGYEDPEGPPDGGGEGGEPEGEDPEALRARARSLGAVAALTKLPGYSYTVEHASSGLTLTGAVASPTERSWTVALTSHPDRVVARWVLTGGGTYTDLSGEWQQTKTLPFDPYFPVSFGPMGQALPGNDAGEHDALMPYYHYVSGEISTRAERLGSREATRVDIKLSEEEGGGGPEGGASPPGAVSVWIAREGGQLLRYRTPPDPREPGTGGLDLMVTPLDAPPDIRVPRVGTPAFEGQPPPWRAPIVARERLAQAGSYRFESPGFGEGQLSEANGQLSGKMDNEGYEMDLALIYIGEQMWGREEKAGPWRRTSLASLSIDGGDGGDDASNAPLLFLYAPAGVPRGLLPPGQRSPIPGWQLFGLDGGAGPGSMRFLGAEEVNGVRALRYSADLTPEELGMGAGEEAGKAKQEIWLAEDGHHLVRSAFSMEGLEGGGQRTDVYDVGKPFELQPPSPVAAPQQAGPSGGVPVRVAWSVEPTAAYAATGLGRGAYVGYRDCLVTNTTYTIPFSVAVGTEGGYALQLVPETQDAESRGMEVTVKPDTVDGEGGDTHEATLTLRTGGEEHLSAFRLSVMAQSDGSMSGNQSRLSVEVPCIEGGEAAP